MFTSQQHGVAVKLPSNRPAVFVRLMGEFAFEYGGQPSAQSTWQRSHARRLIQLLCSAPRCSESRDTVLSVLWPDSDEAHARNRLHHTVHFIRKAWDELPPASRPQLTVNSDRVSVLPAADTLIDVQAFVALAEADLPDAEQQLSSLEQALAMYVGPLANGWDGSAFIDGRRAWLASLREKALSEALDTACELGQTERALHHAHQLALLLESDGAAHCRYALLLAENGRADAALLHCQTVRPLIEAEDTAALASMDQTIQRIQQRANRSEEGAKERLNDRVSEPLIGRTAHGTNQSVLPDARPNTSPGLARAPIPTGQLIGYDSQLELCVRCLHDPYAALTSVVGPPGAGKSLLAATVALRLQSALRHGVLWIDVSQVNNAQGLLDALSQSLTPCFMVTGSDWQSIAQTLQGKELLIVLDGLAVRCDSLDLSAVMALAGRDTRWLVTAVAACHLRGERLVRIEPQQLLQPPMPGAPSPAAQILQRNCVLSAHTQSPRALQPIEQIAALLDGLPLLLEIAGQALTSMSPNELHARLKRDPLALMREPRAPEQDGLHASERPAAQLVQRVLAWLQPASAQMRGMLYLLGHCRSALTREDIEVLLGNPGSVLVNALIEQAVRHQWLLRNAGGPLANSAFGASSEFRVPRIVTATLRLFGDHDEVASSRARIDDWLCRGHLAARRSAAAQATHTTQSANEANEAVASRWFDAHVADIDDAVVACLETGRLYAAARLCQAHARHWSLEQHAALLKVWLEGLGDTMDALEAGTAAVLLVGRARLRVHLGDMQRACEDASHALAQVDRERDAEVSQQALHLLQRYGLGRDRIEPSRSPSLLQRGVDAGESLLRVAQLAVRQGHLIQALPLCAQALDVFEYFGLAHGIVKAHQTRSKIAFALGDTELASRCLTEAERAAQRYGDQREVQRARLMRAGVLLSQMQFPEAISLASGLLTHPDCSNDAALAVRGMGTVAWAYYGMGAYRLAQALCNDMRDQANQTRAPALRLNAQMLSALIEARSQRPEAALRSACNALDLIVTSRPLSDVQGDLVNTAELAICLDRPDLARPLVRALRNFSARPDHRLRDWVSARLDVIDQTGDAHDQPPAREAAVSSPFDVLTTLTSVPSMQ